MIYTYTDEAQLSAHFNVREFRCKCGRSHDIELNPDLILKLEKLYRALGCTKIIITSGYRCSDHDKAVGGNGYGQHTKGNAADIICYDQDGEIINTKKNRLPSTKHRFPRYWQHRPYIHSNTR